MSRSLPQWSIGISATRLTAASFATRDYHPVHHDAAWSRAHGLPGPIVNIMTMEGLVLRYVAEQGGFTDIRRHEMSLGAPTFAGDTLTFAGSAEDGVVKVQVRNDRGPCASAAVELRR